MANVDSPVTRVQILPCPPDRRAEALSLVLCDIAPSQRQEIAATLPPASGAGPKLIGAGLFVAIRGEEMCGAVWGQPQPGNTAIFWPPQLTADEDGRTAYSLAHAAVTELDRAGMSMSQAVLPFGDDRSVAVISAAGFRHLADLVYLSWEADASAISPAGQDLLAVEFVPYDEAQRNRLGQLIERTYIDSLDCAALNGARPIEEVIDGYGSTGVFRAENWLIVRSAGLDVGALILADHPQSHHWELVYMGLVPEARGRGLGRQITRHAQQLALRAHVERIVLAVDAANEPAARMYAAAGFHAWDRRRVYVRIASR